MLAAHNELCVDYEPQSRANWILACCIPFLVITFMFVVGRVYCRLVYRKLFGWDDATFLIAVVSQISGSALLFIMTGLGFGRHLWDVTVPNMKTISLVRSLPRFAKFLLKFELTVLFQLFYVSVILYIFIQTCSKAALAITFLRVFPNKWVRIGSIAVIVTLAGKGIIFLFVVIFQCTPIAAAWDRSIPNAKCVDVKSLVYLAAATALCVDLAILVLPVHSVVSMNMSRSKKFVTLVMLSVGSLACIISAVRIAFIRDLENGPRPSDNTWNDVDTYVWSAMENSLALICACLPALKPVVTMLVPKVFGSLNKSSENSEPPEQPNIPSVKSKRRKPLGIETIPLSTKASSGTFTTIIDTDSQGDEENAPGGWRMDSYPRTLTGVPSYQSHGDVTRSSSVNGILNGNGRWSPTDHVNADDGDIMTTIGEKKHEQAF